MALSYDYFYKINNGTGSESLQEIDIAESKRRLRQQLQTSNHFDRNATRNGEPQGLIVTASDSYYKSRVEALPDEELYVGDVIVSHEHHWVVVNMRVTSPYQTTGLMWLCNCLFRWQNGTSDIIERWGVLDSGVYSSTKDGDKRVETADKQYKIYLPYDEDTKKLYVDKRLATDVVYNQNLEEILNVIAVTGVDPRSRSYGNGGHLLILNVRNDDFVAGRDNVEQCICDYIDPGDDPGPSGDLLIDGPNTIRIGGRRTYCAACENPTWSWDAPGDIEGFAFEDGIFMLEVPLLDYLIGDVIAITVTDGTSTGTLDVEVIG